MFFFIVLINLGFIILHATIYLLGNVSLKLKQLAI